MNGKTTDVCDREEICYKGMTYSYDIALGELFRERGVDVKKVFENAIDDYFIKEETKNV